MYSNFTLDCLTSKSREVDGVPAFANRDDQGSVVDADEPET